VAAVAVAAAAGAALPGGADAARAGEEPITNAVALTRQSRRAVLRRLIARGLLGGWMAAGPMAGLASLPLSAHAPAR
jgi:hypothetical protein